MVKLTVTHEWLIGVGDIVVGFFPTTAPTLYFVLIPNFNKAYRDRIFIEELEKEIFCKDLNFLLFFLLWVHFWTKYGAENVEGCLRNITLARLGPGLSVVGG